MNRILRFLNQFSLTCFTFDAGFVVTLNVMLSIIVAHLRVQQNLICK